MRASRALSSTVRFGVAMGRPGSRGTGRAFSNVGGSKVMMGTDFILLIMANPRDRLPREKLQSCAHNSTEPAAPLIAKSFSIAAFFNKPRNLAVVRGRDCS